MADIGSARIKIEADTSGFAQSASAGVNQALNKIQAQANTAFAGISRSGKASLDSVASSATDSGGRIANSLGSIGSRASSAFSQINASANRMFAPLDSGIQAAGGAISGLGSRISGAVNNMVGSFSKVGSSARSAFNDAEGAGAGLINKISGIGLGMAALAAPASVFEKGWKRATGFQEAEIRFRSMGIEGQQFTDTMAMLNTVVKGTSAGLDEAANQASMLLTSGVHAGSELQETMEAMVTASAVGGRSVSDLGLVFSQVAAAGKLQSEDANQLVGASVPIWAWLGKSMNKSVADVREAASKGTITFNDMVQAIRQNGGSLAKDMSKTFKGQVSSVSSALGRMGEVIAKPILALSNQVLPVVASFVDAVSKKIQAFGAFMSSGSQAATLLKYALSAISATALIGSLGALIKTIGGIGGVVNIATTAIRGMGIAFLATPVGLLVGGIAALVAGFVYLFNTSDSFRVYWVGVWNGVQTAFAPVIENIVTKFNQLKTMLMAGFDLFMGKPVIDADKILPPGVINTVSNGWQRIQDATGTALAQLGTKAGEAKTLFIGVGSALMTGDTTGLPFGLDKSEAVVNAINGIREVVSAVIGQYSAWISSISSAFSVLATYVMPLLLPAFNDIKDALATVWDSLKTFAGGAINLISSLMPVLAPIGKFIAFLGGALLVVIGGVLIGAIRAIAFAIKAVVTIANFLIHTVLVPGFNILAVVFRSIIPIIMGIWNGIVTGVTWVGNAINSAVAWVQNAIKVIGDWFTSVIATVSNAISTAVAWIANIISGIVALFVKIQFYIAVFNYIVGAIFYHWGELIVGYFANLLEPITTPLMQAWQAFVNAMVAAWQWLVTTVSSIWNTVATFVMGVITAIGGFITTAFNATVLAITMLWTNLVAALTVIWQNIILVFTTIWGGLVVAYQTVIQPVIDAIVNAFNWLWQQVVNIGNAIAGAVTWIGDTFSSLWSTYVQPMIDAVVGGFNHCLDVVQGFGNSIINAMAGAGSWLYTAGQNIVQGLLNGIGSLSHSIGEWFISTLPGWIQAPFRRALGIASPSKVFAGYGRNITDGLIQGIGANQQGVTSSVAALGTSVSGFTPGSVQVPDVSGLDSVADSIRKAGELQPVLDALQAGIGLVVAAFDTGATAIAAAMERLREGVASPIRFTIDSVFNNGLVAVWNSVASTFGTQQIAAMPVGFAQGGYVSGAGTSVSDSIPARLSNGEYVVNARAVQSVGVNTLDAINSNRWSGFAGQTLNALNVSMSQIPDSASGVMARGFANGLFNAMSNALDKLMEKVLSGAEGWRNLAIIAMQRTGFNYRDESQIGAMLAQIQSESGGNAGIAQQIVDINGTGESAAVGLLQIIPGTFAAYRDESLPNDRRDPLANMTAALNYYRARYGTDLTTVWGHGHGYHEGGLMGAGAGLIHKTATEPEMVLSPKQSEALIDYLRNGAPGGNGAMRRVEVTQNIYGNDAAEESANRILQSLERL